MLRVLMLIKGLGPGGAEQLLVHQARRRADDVRYEAAYLVPGKDHLVGELEAAGVPVRCLGGAAAADVRWLGQLRARLAVGDLDVIHVHSPLVAAGARLVVGSLPRRRRPALVVTEHNRWEQYAAPTRWANRLTYGRDDWRVAVSEGVRASVSPRWRSQVEVVVHGIDVEAVAAWAAQRDAVRAAWGIGPGTVVVGTVANLRPEKAYPDLVAAAAAVLDPGADPAPDVVVVAVGQGPREAEVRSLVAAAGLEDRFRLLGYQPEAARLVAGFDLFVLASHHEGLPLAVMEAQALGLPVVATAVGGLPEVIEPGLDGLLVPPAQPRRLAEAIADLVADAPRRRAMGDAARERAARFDAAAATAALEAGYRRLAAARAGGGA